MCEQLPKAQVRTPPPVSDEGMAGAPGWQRASNAVLPAHPAMSTTKMFVSNKPVPLRSADEGMGVLGRAPSAAPRRARRRRRPGRAAQAPPPRQTPAPAAAAPRTLRAARRCHPCAAAAAPRAPRPSRAARCWWHLQGCGHGGGVRRGGEKSSACRSTLCHAPPGLTFRETTSCSMRLFGLVGCPSVSQEMQCTSQNTTNKTQAQIKTEKQRYKEHI